LAISEQKRGKRNFGKKINGPSGIRQLFSIKTLERENNGALPTIAAAERAHCI